VPINRLHIQLALYLTGSFALQLHQPDCINMTQLPEYSHPTGNNGAGVWDNGVIVLSLRLLLQVTYLLERALRRTSYRQLTLRLCLNMLKRRRTAA
jgi:hypothetical protein